MKSEPFVSIVIPTTGKVKFIRGLVESVIKLDYPKNKFELILIGDENTDLIEKHSKIAIENGIKTVLISEENKKDLSEIDKEIIKYLNIIPVVDAKSILEYTLTKPIIALNLTESDILKSQKNNITSTNLEKTRTH